MTDEIVNRVASSALVTFDLEDYYHHGQRVVFDIKDQLYEGLLLREKDFRAFVKAHDWQQYEGKNVALTCTADAIVPVWAYMLVTTKLQPYAHMVVMGDLPTLELALYQEALKKVDPEQYRDGKIVIKGCGKYPVPDAAYVEIARLLGPYVSSMMYGEPCSTVPIYKRPRAKA